MDLAAQGALVRPSFQNIELMDAPSKLFFNLEKKNGQKRFIHNLRSETGVLLSDPFEIRNRTVGFYRKLYESELFLDESDVRTNTLILIKTNTPYSTLPLYDMPCTAL